MVSFFLSLSLFLLATEIPQTNAAVVSAVCMNHECLFALRLRLRYGKGGTSLDLCTPEQGLYCVGEIYPAPDLAGQELGVKWRSRRKWGKRSSNTPKELSCHVFIFLFCPYFLSTSFLISPLTVDLISWRYGMPQSRTCLVADRPLYKPHSYDSPCMPRDVRCASAFLMIALTYGAIRHRPPRPSPRLSLEAETCIVAATY